MKVRRLSMTAANMLASLEGRKAVTRRVMKPQPPEGYNRVAEYVMDPTLSARFENDSPPLGMWTKRSPYGSPGDPLVLTETWRPAKVKRHKAAILYKADGVEMWREIPNQADHERICNAHKHGRWLPPRFMQAWASRAPAVNKEVRVERVQEITEEDAKAEGIQFTDWGEYTPPGKASLDGGKTYHPFKPRQHDECYHWRDSPAGPEECLKSAKSAFANLWNSINEKRGHGWHKNDWVWVIGYELTS